MFCTRCGRDNLEKDNFCAACGAPVRDVPMMPARSRLAGHVRALGICWLAVSAFRLLPGAVLLILVDHGFFARHEVPFVAPLLEGVAVVLLTLAMAGLAAGWGLLARQPWARMLAIVLGTVSLIDMPFGTALGVYSLWVLLPAESEAQYQRMMRNEPA